MQRGNTGSVLASQEASQANTQTRAFAALIFASWRAWPALYACLLFGFLQASGNYLQGVRIGGFEVPVQFINMLPYLLTVVLLAGFIGKSIPPRASGIPYAKDR